MKLELQDNIQAEYKRNTNDQIRINRKLLLAYRAKIFGLHFAFI